MDVFKNEWTPIDGLRANLSHPKTKLKLVCFFGFGSGENLQFVSFSPRASERRVLQIVELCYTSSYVHIFTASHVHILTSSHLLVFTLSPSFSLFSSSRLLIFTSSHLHSLSSSLSFSLSLSLSLPPCPRSRSLSFFFSSLCRPCQKLIVFLRVGLVRRQPFRTK